MTDVRSAVLGRVHTLIGGAFTLYTTPAGHTALVKSISFTNNDSITQRLHLLLYDPVGRAAAYLLLQDIPSDGIVTWSGWHALSPGDQVSIYSGGPFDCWVSGTDLVGVVPPQAPTVRTAPPGQVPLQGSGSRRRARRRSMLAAVSIAPQQ